MNEQKRGLPDEPLFVKRTPLYEGFLKLYKDRFMTSEGMSFDYEILCPYSAAAVVLPVLENGQLVLVKEYRYPLQRYLLSLPGGYIDEGETAEQAASRELREEVGLSCDEIVMLGKTYPYAGISNQCIYYLWAKNCLRSHSVQHETSELILLQEYDLAQLLKELCVPLDLDVDGNLTTALFYYLQKINGVSLS